MKRVFALFLLFSLLALSLASCGSGDKGDDTPTLCSEGLAYSVSLQNPGECIITGIGSCTDRNIVIPSDINGMRVVGIADGAFSPKRLTREVAAALARRSTLSLLSAYTPLYEYTPADRGEGYRAGEGEPIALREIESITIPSSVRSIGKEAFYGCEELADIQTPTSLSEIGKDAFKETAYYNDPGNWDGAALYLSNYLITVSDSVSGEFTIKEGTTMIANSAFYRCEYVTTVHFASSVTTVGDSAFYGCTSLTYTNCAPSANVQFAENAFEGCIYYSPIYQGPGGVTVTPGNPGASGPSRQYAEITEAIFEAARKSLPVRYTYRAILAEEHQGSFTTIKTDGVNSYYMHSVDGDTQKELYVSAEGSGTTAYGYFGDGLYRTTATIPAPITIPEELHFSDLVCTREAKGAVYSYETSDGRERMQLGFRDGRLVFLQIDTPLYTLEVTYGDFDTTEVPLPSLELLIPGITVDENGSIIQ